MMLASTELVILLGANYPVQIGATIKMLVPLEPTTL